MEPIFPAEPWHNHASSLVETPRGALLACWFHGSGERKADDVLVQASRLPRAGHGWEPRFTLDDAVGFPDCNPCLFVDPSKRLWFFHITIVANTWESSILTWKRAAKFERPGPPRWGDAGLLLLKPGVEFDAAVARDLPLLEADSARIRSTLTERQRVEMDAYLGAFRTNLAEPMYRRLGWMTRIHPVVLKNGRWLLPLYHDGFSCSLFAISDDAGVHWRPSAPILGGGNVQPCVVERRDGRLMALMRDNGPPPARALVAESADRGETWTPARDSDIPNPGSSLEAVVLRSGRWLLVLNDTEQGRHSLAAWLSADEGSTWPWRRSLARCAPGAGGFAYPSVLQTRDGSLHATFSSEAAGKSTIVHARFSEEWLLRAPR